MLKNNNFRDYLNVVSKRHKTVWVFFICIVGIVFIITFSEKPKYEGETQFVLDKNLPSDLTGRSRFDPSDPEFFQTQFQLIKSRAVAYRVIDNLSLEKNYDTYFLGNEKSSNVLIDLLSLVKKSKAKISAFFFASEKDAEKKGEMTRKELLAEELSKNLRVVPVESSRMVAVSYLSTSPQLAALIPNAVVKAFIEENLNMKMEATRHTLDWMAKKAEGERVKLDKAEKAMQSYMGTNGILSIENRVAVVPEKLLEISSQLVKAEAKRKEMEALYQKVKSVGGNLEAAETISAIASDVTLQELRTQIFTVEKDIMELLGKYGRKHPIMIKAEGDLQVLKRKRNQEISRIVQSIRNEYELARTVEEGLRSQFNATKGEAQNANEKFIQYSAMKREVDTNQQLYDALILKMKEQSITQENQSVDVWVVEEARVPTKPSKPMKLLNMLLGTIVGLFGGIGLAFFREYLDNTIKNPEEAEAGLQTPVLGMIPLCKNSESIEDVVLKEPRSVIAESYKALRTALLLSAADAPPKKILITSSVPGEGKTTTSVNLAVALAQSENRVLLIDGDLRKPRIHTIFGLNNQKGLSSYLAGTTGGDILEKGPMANLVIIPAGPIAPNPSELLASSRMKKLLDTLDHEFDIIICDSPPVLAMADSRILTRYFDGTVVVAKTGYTTYDMARKSLKMLRDVNALVLGLLLNAQDLKESDYYYSSYYEPLGKSKKRVVAPEQAG